MHKYQQESVESENKTLVIVNVLLQLKTNPEQMGHFVIFI